MEPRPIAKCPECGQPVFMGENFVCFKTPGKNSYQFFHHRFRSGDCWELHLTKNPDTLPLQPIEAT